MLNIKIAKMVSKMSIWGKVLAILSIICIVVVVLKRCNVGYFKEGFTNTNKNNIELTKTVKIDSNSPYDEFYSSIYDDLVYSDVKTNYEVDNIIRTTIPTTDSVILDVGCGTGHHVAALSERNLDVKGIDISSAMIDRAQKNYPDIKGKYKKGDVMDSFMFDPATYSHILCLYFTIYYIQDKPRFFENCMKWLVSGGYLLVHLVNRDKFDPILPPGNPLLLVSPQKYAKKRITSTKVNFDSFTYDADFKLDAPENTGYFVEKFKDNKTGAVREQKHIMYMEDLNDIVTDATDAGFIVNGFIDLLHCQYEYQYIYIFQKP